MEAKLQRAIADLRVDVARNKGGLVRVFADQLTTVLDALEETMPEPVDDVIREGNRVVIVDYTMDGSIRNGMEGTVKKVKNTSNYPYRVLVDEALTYYPSGALFARDELKKVE